MKTFLLLYTFVVASNGGYIAAEGETIKAQSYAQCESIAQEREKILDDELNVVPDNEKLFTTVYVTCNRR